MVSLLQRDLCVVEGQFGTHLFEPTVKRMRERMRGSMKQGMTCVNFMTDEIAFSVTCEWRGSLAHIYLSQQ
jgi:hypothetical protein